MPSTYTGAGIELIANGEQSGTWGDTTNDNLAIIDRLTSQAGTISLSGTTHTLTISDGTLSDGQYGVLVFGGSPTGTNTVTISPNDSKRIFIAKNSSGESVVLTQGSGGNVTIPDGDMAIVYSDGGGAGAAVVDVTSTYIQSSDIGSSVQAWDANLDQIAALAVTDGNFIVGNGSAWVAESGATARTSLGLGTAATSAATDFVAVTGDSMTGDLSFGDNDKAIFGAGSDLQIYHNGSDSYIDEAGTGNLYIRANASTYIMDKNTSEVCANFASNGAVTLYYDNNAKLATTSSGIDVTGTITFDGGTTSADLNFGDNDKAVFGAGSDLQVYHDGSNSYIDDNGTGTLRIRGSSSVYIQKLAGESIANFNEDGSVDLYYDNLVKFQTTSYGVSVTGSAVATTDTDTSNSGSVTLNFDTNQNFVLTLTGNVTLANPSTEKVGQSGFIVFIQDGTGGRTVSLGTDYETAGGAGLTLSSAASATDIVPYVVAASGRILLGTPQLAFS